MKGIVRLWILCMPFVLSVSCDNEKSACEQLEKKMDECIDQACQDPVICESYCTCWNDGHHVPDNSGNCVEPEPDPNPLSEQECRDGLNDFDPVCGALLLAISMNCP